MKIQQTFANFAKSAKVVKILISKFQLDNLVDFEKCCKARIYLQKSAPVQPKTSDILPKFCRSAVVSPTGAEPDVVAGIVDRVGRRPLLLRGLVAMAACMAAIP